jgi:TRAF-type zinc finger
MELSVICTNDNCNDVVRRCDIDKHIQKCPLTLVACQNNPFCGSILRKDHDKHINESCHFREVSCLLLCGARLPLNEVDQHIRMTCPKSEIMCRNKCGNKV